MFYKIKYSPKIEKESRRISTPELKLIKKQIEDKLTEDPYYYGKPLGYSLKGARTMRVGSYRIIYRIVNNIVIIVAIDKRSEVYGGH